MVANHFRWDFIGLSTDDKPTPETSPKVADGSTYYTSDDSKLYVWYKDQWYEKTPTGGGGGGTTNFNALSNRPKYNGTTMTGSTDIPEVITYTAGTNVSISEEGEISATDTTYSDFVGTDGTATGTAGLVPAPATTDTDKYLKSDGTWSTVSGGGGGPTVVQTTGTSTTDVMSQNATTSMVFADAGTDQKVQVGNGAAATGGSSVSIGRDSKAEAVSATAVGRNADAKAQSSTAVGYYAQTNGEGSVAIGESSTGGSSSSVRRAVAIGSNADAGPQGSIAIGAYSYANSVGEMNIGAFNQTAYGYNNTMYRLLSGVYDAQGDHDAVNLSQLNGRVKTNAGAPTTSTVGTVGQLLEDTTNGKLYQCTADNTVDPQYPDYTWTEIGAGGSGPTVVQTSGTSTTDVMSQNAVTSMLFANPGTNTQIRIGSTGSVSNNAIRIGHGGNATNTSAISIGNTAQVSGINAIAIGPDSLTMHRGSVALGSSAQTTVKGQVMVGTTNTYDGYNSTNYRIISGVHDAQSANDAVNLSQLNSRVLGSLTAAPTTSTAGAVGSLIATVESGTGHLYICTDDTGGTYTWSQLV